MTGDRMFAPLNRAVQALARDVRESEIWRTVLPVPDDAPPSPIEGSGMRKPAAHWTYRNAAGDLLGYVVRFNNADGSRDFLPLTFGLNPNSNAKPRWRWKSWPAPRPLYGLDRLAHRPGAPVVVTEGEKAADAAQRLLPDRVAITSPNGARAADKADWTPLAGRQVVIWPDSDEAGQSYARVAANCIAAVGGFVSIAIPPAGVAAGWDAADAEAEGWNAERTLQLLLNAETWKPDTRSRPDVSEARRKNEGGRREKPSRGNHSAGEPAQRSRLQDLTANIELWHSESREAFASLPVNGHFENWPVRSADFRHWLMGQYYRDTGATPGGQAMEDALRLVEARAVMDGKPHRTWLRIGGDTAAGLVYVDLADADWSAVEITANGWRVISQAPVKFLRTRGMRSLPVPIGGDLIEKLHGYINCEGDADFQLIVAWLLGALRPQGPFPILVINGEQGSSKSTLARVLRSLLDPNVAPGRSAPREERDLFVAAVNGWCISVDNLSVIADWLSDALCRLATGGGVSFRQNYTDRDEMVLEATRPILLNGIPELTGRPDLADRAIGVTLPVMEEGKRRTEEEFWAAFESDRPGILGALYDAVAAALRNAASVRLDVFPRMADFTKWITAAEPELGWPEGSFVEVYKSNRTFAVRGLIENSPLGQALLRVVEHEDWESSPTELLNKLDSLVDEKTRKGRWWPATPSKLGSSLSRLAPALRQLGIDARQSKGGRDSRRLWTLKRTRAPEPNCALSTI